MAKFTWCDLNWHCVNKLKSRLSQICYHLHYCVAEFHYTAADISIFVGSCRHACLFLVNGLRKQTEMCLHIRLELETGQNKFFWQNGASFTKSSGKLWQNYNIKATNHIYIFDCSSLKSIRTFPRFAILQPQTQMDFSCNRPSQRSIYLYNGRKVP